MVLAELVHNAVEHGFEERGDVAATCGAAGGGQAAADGGRARDDVLEVGERQRAAGYPPGTDPAAQGLGMQIVEALISDLRGHDQVGEAKPHGTVVRFTVRLRWSPEAEPDTGSRPGRPSE